MRKNYGKILESEDVLVNEPMKNHTSFKIGGPADYFINIKSLDILMKVKELAKKSNIPFHIIGNGSNLLVLDKGVRGIVGKLKFDKIEIVKDENKVIASADVSSSKLARVCAQNGLSGLEFLSGIPGTIGGAIKMNAGAYGLEIKDVIVKTKYLDESGNIKELLKENQKFEYRRSFFSDNDLIILEAEFLLKSDTVQNIENKISEMMEKRREKQPLEYPSAGSIFKRKNNIITAKLIDECGLKGFEIGGAKISEKHAGFVINNGNATAKDVLELVEHVKKEVYQRFKENIELEVIILGEM